MKRKIKKVIEGVFNIEVRRKSNSSKIDPVFSSYQDALKSCPVTDGYEFSLLVDVIVKKTKAYQNSLQGQITEVSAPQSFALNVLQEIAQHQRVISVLDFGGACGAHYLLARKLLQAGIELNWKVVETPLMVKRAKLEFESKELKFYDSIESASSSFTENFDLIFTSSALQYTDDPLSHLEKLLSLGSPSVLLLRANMSLKEKIQVKIQKSSLSANGIGPLPDGMNDLDIFYPNTIVPKKDLFKKFADAGYEQKINFLDQTGVVSSDQIGFGGLFQKI